MRKRAFLLILASGLILSLASSACSGRSVAIYAEIMGCEHGCDVAAAGWPTPYLIDYPGISVVGSVDLIGALVGEDHFRLLPFLLTAVFWSSIATLILVVGRRVRAMATR